MNYNYYLNLIKEKFRKYNDFDANKIPLCAAENYVSPFSKQSLGSILEGKYITGNKYYDANKDFIGSEYLKEFLDLSNELGKQIFNAKYTDFRCLSGMNAIAIVLMSMIDKSKKILITDPNSGGHGSLPKLCDNLGIKYESIPYNIEKMQIDYNKLNNILEIDNSIDALFFCQSDLINIPELIKINISSNIKIIYDATQTLGLIASKIIDNPLNKYKNLMLIGATHKTFPGVTCGFIATNNEDYIDLIDKQISPNFLRNTQINNIVSTCLTMIEILKIGKDYSNEIIKAANSFGKLLESYDVKVKKINSNQYTMTHQIFIEVDPSQIDSLYMKFKQNNITLNKRNTPYIKGFRLGLQEVARYELVYHLDELAFLISGVINNTLSNSEISDNVLKLSKYKKDNYYISDIFME